MGKEKSMATKAEKLEYLHNIKRIARKCKNKQIFARVTHVSNSGMSRNIHFVFITKKGETSYPTYWISQILGYRYNNYDDSVHVGGCGADMIFQTLYNLNSVAKLNEVIRTSKKQNEHDIRYRGLVDTDYRTI